MVLRVCTILFSIHGAMQFLFELFNLRPLFFITLAFLRKFYQTNLPSNSSQTSHSVGDDMVKYMSSMKVENNEKNSNCMPLSCLKINI